MTEDKGQNQVVIDWLVDKEARGSFVTSETGELGYSELGDLVDRVRNGEVSSVRPLRDAASVRAIYEAVARGPAIIRPSGEWIGVSLPSDVMTLLQTSGSTGMPKLVPLTLDNWKAAVAASANHLGHLADDIWLAAMPLHHVGGLSILFRSSFVGAKVHLLGSFEPGSFADALSDNVTMASVVPTMLRRILDHDRRRYSDLKAVLVGGGPIPEGLLEEAHDRGIPALPTYGMTETCAQVATLSPGSTPMYRADLLPGIEARIEESGRIALRGAQVFDGYFGEARREAGEWFVTGDLGKVGDRTIEITGRADDVIITGGENVDPVRVEAALAAIGGSGEVMVVAVPSEEWGNEVVCLYTGTADGETLESGARSVLEGHEIPKEWVRVNEIPETGIGKPDRAKGRQIAETLGGGSESVSPG